MRDILVEVIRKGAEGTTANENILVTSLAGWSTSSNTARQSIVVSTANGNVTGTACPSLWGGQTTGEAWQRYAAFDKLEYCQYDSCFYALNLYTTGACQLYKLTPPANPMSGTWAWSMETLTAKNGEALAIRSLPYRETHDARLFGKMRYVPPLKCFVLSDSAEKPAQALRSSTFL